LSIGKRIQRLEARAGKPANILDEWGYRSTMLYCKEVENYRREQEGLPPIPLTPEEQEWERELDEKFLQDGLPRMRGDPGWQTAEAQALLDEWEHEIRGTLEKGDS
jgi:hypothetical protein